MFRSRWIAVATLLAATSSAAVAQDLTTSVCPNGTLQEQALQDACQQAYDLFQFMAPRIGLSLAGGSTTLGQGGSLGGLPHFTLSIRGNALSTPIPDVANFTQNATGAQKQTLPTNDGFVGLPTVDAAIGIFKGIPLSLTNVGGIDLLASAMFVPTYDKDGVSVKPTNSLAIGYGARVGLLQESLLVPGVSVSYMERKLPETDLSGAAGGVDLQAMNMKVETTSWRLMASKSFLLFSIHGGVGQDKYDESADISGSAGGFTSSIPGTNQSLTRTNYFGGVSFNLLVMKIVAEAGQTSGGTIATFNGFDGGRADKSQVYASVGLRVGF